MVRTVLKGRSDSIEFRSTRQSQYCNICIASNFKDNNQVSNLLSLRLFFSLSFCLSLGRNPRFVFFICYVAYP